MLAIFDQRDDGAVLLHRRAIDLVIVVEADHRHVGGNFQDLEIVDVLELVRLGGRRAGHAGELLVHAEIVLERDRGQRLVLRLDRLPLLGLERLVQALRIAPARHHAAGELVDDDDLAVAHDVVLVALEQLVRAQGLIHMVHDRDVLDVIERIGLELAGFAQPLLHLFHADFGEIDGALFLVDLVVGLVELGDVGVDGVVELGTVVERTGNDQRGARLVDQDRIDLVDDGVGVPALHHVLEPVLHVVAQVVEAELVVGAVGDVAVVFLLALLVVETMDDDAHREPEELVDLPHPFGVAFGQIIVDGDDVHAAAGQGVEIDRQRRDQGLAFAGLHLGDLAFMQHHAADELDVEVALAERALAGLAYGGERRHQDVVQRRPFGQLLLEGVGPRAQCLVGELLQIGFQGIDGGDLRPIGADTPVVGGTEQLASDSADHRVILPLSGRAAELFGRARSLPKTSIHFSGIMLLRSSLGSARSAHGQPAENAALFKASARRRGRLDYGRDIGGGGFVVNARRPFTRSLGGVSILPLPSGGVSASVRAGNSRHSKANCPHDQRIAFHGLHSPVRLPRARRADNCCVALRADQRSAGAG